MGGVPPGKVALGSIRIRAGQANKQHPSWLLHQLLPPGFCPVWAPVLAPSMMTMTWKCEPHKPFPPQVALVMVLHCSNSNPDQDNGKSHFSRENSSGMDSAPQGYLKSPFRGHISFRHCHMHTTEPVKWLQSTQICLVWVRLSPFSLWHCGTYLSVAQESMTYNVWFREYCEVLFSWPILYVSLFVNENSSWKKQNKTKRTY